MTNSIHFHIQGFHESHTGSADIINSANQIKELYAEYYNVYTHLVTERKIGEVQIEDEKFEIHEAYFDSGSEDYLYFAIKL